MTRAGRLGVKIRVDPTDKAGQIEIINGYLATVRCAAEVDVEGFALDTTGLTPADLKTIIVRRALARALFAGREGITDEDLRASLAEQSMGLRQPIAGMQPEDKRAIAYHEAGHAVATWALTEDKIARVSIIRYSGGPSGGASLGHVSPVPEEERWSRSLSEVEAKICVSLSGRAADLEFPGHSPRPSHPERKHLKRPSRSLTTKPGRCRGCIDRAGRRTRRMGRYPGQNPEH